MYPYEIVFGMGMYEILLALGFFSALLYFRIFADRVGFGAKMQNLVIVCALAALIGGYGFAVLIALPVKEMHFSFVLLSDKKQICHTVVGNSIAD